MGKILQEYEKRYIEEVLNAGGEEDDVVRPSIWIAIQSCADAMAQEGVSGFKEALIEQWLTDPELAQLVALGFKRMVRAYNRFRKLSG